MVRSFIHVCVIIMIAACVTACNQQQPEPLPAAQSKPALPDQASMRKESKFGISDDKGLNNDFRSYKIASGKPFKIRGWYISDEPTTISYAVNGEYGATQSEKRSDVSQKYPDYQFCGGWITAIPADKLKSKNIIDFYLGDKNVWTIEVKVD